MRRSLTVTTSTSIGSPFAAPVCLWVLVSLQPPRVFIQKIAAVTRALRSTGTAFGSLAGAFLQQIVKKYEGTRLGRQELNAELLDDVPGAL